MQESIEGKFVFFVKRSARTVDMLEAQLHSSLLPRLFSAVERNILAAADKGAIVSI